MAARQPPADGAEVGGGDNLAERRGRVDVRGRWLRAPGMREVVAGCGDPRGVWPIPESRGTGEDRGPPEQERAGHEPDRAQGLDEIRGDHRSREGAEGSPGAQERVDAFGLIERESVGGLRPEEADGEEVEHAEPDVEHVADGERLTEPRDGSEVGLQQSRPERQNADEAGEAEGEEPVRACGQEPGLDPGGEKGVDAVGRGHADQRADPEPVEIVEVALNAHRLAHWAEHEVRAEHEEERGRGEQRCGSLTGAKVDHRRETMSRHAGLYMRVGAGLLRTVSGRRVPRAGRSPAHRRPRGGRRGRACGPGCRGSEPRFRGGGPGGPCGRSGSCRAGHQPWGRR